MHRPTFRILPVAIALALGSGWAAAQTAAATATSNGKTHGTTASAKADTKLSHADKEFIEDAAKGGMAEVAIGKIASQKGSDAGVKELGNRLVQDHSKANEELMQLAQSKGVKVPDESKMAEKHDIKKMEKLSGDKFDREFAQHSVKDHEKDIKKFEKAASKLHDPDLKAWAEKQLPVLREHLAMAQKLEGTSGKDNAAMGHTGTGATSGKKSSS